MCTVRPKLDSSNLDGQVADVIKKGDDAAGCELNPVEEVHEEEDDVAEGTPAKVLRSPSAPSRQDMLEHSVTHFPFRSWCIHCVKGKCKSSKHSSAGGAEESAVPIVGFDYAFLSARDNKVSSDDGDTEAVSNGVMKVLVAHDSKSKTCAAIPVPQKGVDQEEWAV